MTTRVKPVRNFSKITVSCIRFHTHSDTHVASLKCCRLNRTLPALFIQQSGFWVGKALRALHHSGKESSGRTIKRGAGDGRAPLRPFSCSQVESQGPTSSPLSRDGKYIASL